MYFKSAKDALRWYVGQKFEVVCTPKTQAKMSMNSPIPLGRLRGATAYLIDVLRKVLAPGEYDENLLDQEGRMIAMIDLEKMLSQLNQLEKQFLLLYGDMDFAKVFQLYSGRSNDSASFAEEGTDSPKQRRMAAFIERWLDKPCWERTLPSGKRGRCFHRITRQNQHARASELIKRFENILRENDYLWPAEDSFAAIANTTS